MEGDGGVDPAEVHVGVDERLARVHDPHARAGEPGEPVFEQACIAHARILSAAGRPRGIPGPRDTPDRAPAYPRADRGRRAACENQLVSERSAVIVAIVTLILVAGTGVGAYLRSRSRTRDIDAP